MKVAVIFGGKSTEHDISIISGTSVISNLNKNKYDIYPIYQDLEGNFFEYQKDLKDIKALKIGEQLTDLKPIPNIITYLQAIDVVFPVLHGLYGEDGSIQGLLELLGKKYVGCHILSSSLCLDKVYTKIILERANITQAKSMYLKKTKANYVYINKNFQEKHLTIDELNTKIETYLHYPVFIKPSNSGSSVGVNKATNKSELEKYLIEAFTYDTKVLIEEEIKGKEVECAILGNEKLIVSTIGEIIPASSFYSYASKYINKNSKTIIPANISNNLIQEIQNIAKKAYLACDCKGLSRIDFFIEDNTNRIILNEINTMPGFTEISMYPKLMENYGFTYSQLLDKLISLAT